jgi:hypothetical protein
LLIVIKQRSNLTTAVCCDRKLFLKKSSPPPKCLNNEKQLINISPKTLNLFVAVSFERRRCKPIEKQTVLGGTKLSISSLTVERNKLERLSLPRFFKASKIR